MRFASHREALRFCQLVQALTTRPIFPEGFRTLEWPEDEDRDAAEERTEPRPSRASVFGMAPPAPIIDADHSVSARSVSGHVASQRSLKIWVGTWNMGNAQPEYDKLDGWMESKRRYHDVYAVGVQECSSEEWIEMLSQVPRGSTPHPRAPHAASHAHPASVHLVILRALPLPPALSQHLGISYVRVADRSMGQIKLVVFIHRRHAHALSSVETSYVPTGVLGIGKNKVRIWDASRTWCLAPSQHSAI